MAKIKVRLSEPIVIEGGTKVSVLELRDKITLGDLLSCERAGGGDLQKDVFLYSLLAGLLPEDLHGLTVDDYEAVKLAVAAAKKPVAPQKPVPPST